MRRTTFDPGLTQQYGGRLRRAINPDGSFNVVRRGFAFRDTGFYVRLARLGWPAFFAFVVAGYFLVNLLFSGVYLLVGLDHLQGADTSSRGAAFESAFFFSVHTMTTVGYGNMVPRGWVMNLTAAIETMIGLLSFAVATGLLFARFSRPSANLMFSRHMLVSPYQSGAALMFRIANRRPNVLMELEARALLMTVEDQDGRLQRRYQPLTLERPSVYFLPLSWTVVHPIDSSSPFWGMDPDTLTALQAEVLILIKGFDDNFGATVHARHSYPHEEIAWGRRFLPAFSVNNEGDLVLELDRLHQHEPSALPAGGTE